MSLHSIKVWVEKGFKSVEQNGSHWVRLRLSGDGQVWQTWDKAPSAPHWPTADEYIEELTTLLEALSDELPVRRHTLMLTAEDGASGVLGQVPHSITGKNKAAQEIGQQGAAKAFSEAMRSLAETMDMVSKSARDQLSAQNHRIAEDAEEIRSLHVLLREHRAAELLQEQNSGAVSEVLMNGLKEAQPLIMGVGELLLERAKATAAEKAKAGAAAKTVSTVVEAAAKPLVTVTASPVKPGVST